MEPSSDDFRLLILYIILYYTIFYINNLQSSDEGPVDPSYGRILVIIIYLTMIN